MLIRLHDRYFINTDFVKWISFNDEGNLKIILDDGSSVTTDAICVDAISAAQKSLVDYCKKQHDK